MNHRGEDGTSLLEVLVTVALVATVTSLGTPLVLHAHDEQQGRQAAAFLAGQLRAARQQAVLTGRHAALVFDPAGETWVFTMCSDGNGDGVLRADVASGTDTCAARAQPIGAWFSQVSIDRAPGVPGVSGDADGGAVALGPSRIASFSPMGTASSGSVTLRTRGDRHFAVRVAGVTGRVRVLRFAPETQRWQDL